MTLITITGPTAVGKTKLAVSLANAIDGEVISADSRQVYRQMDLGTGKDLADFNFQGKKIPYHLIDIKQAGEEYNLFDFQQDFYRAYLEILNRSKTPILCGGSGLYVETALAKEKLFAVPTDEKLRKKWEDLTHEELQNKLLKINENQHNTTDLTDRERTVRALEIETYKNLHQENSDLSPVQDYIIFGLTAEREYIRSQIQIRLDKRIEQGMIEEVENLLNSGISHEKLNYYGLEYRFIAAFLKGEISYDDMYEKLLQAIRRFAKKQMTWFRRMEKRGHKIHWLNVEAGSEENLNQILSKIASFEKTI